MTLTCPNQDLTRSQILSVAAEIQASGGTALAVQADVSDEAAVRRGVDVVAQAFGGLDLVVTNAGIPGGPPTTLDRMDIVAGTADST